MSLYFVVSQVCFFPKGQLLGDHATPVDTDEVNSSYQQSRVLADQVTLVEETQRSFQSCMRALARQLFAIPASSTARDSSFSAAGCKLQCQRGAVHCRLRTSMTTCLYIRINSKNLSVYKSC